MQRITIIGAGQAGLQLGVGLLGHDLEVVLVTDRSPDELKNEWVTSSQLMFGDALQAERDFALNYWDETCPSYSEIAVSVHQPGGAVAAHWQAPLAPPAQSVDQRLKFSRWIERFVELGGNLVIERVAISDLERFSESSDLVVVASGKGSLSSVFRVNADHSPFSGPERRTTVIYATMVQPLHDGHGGLALIPGAGEIAWFPAITLTGPCYTVNFGCVIGGPMDKFKEGDPSESRLEKAKVLLGRYLPHLSRNWAGLNLTDQKATLTGSILPVVRYPVGNLPSGRIVLGIGDAVVLNDPIAAQGSNSAAKAARVYQKSIGDYMGRSFDRAWMQETFEAYWQDARWSVALSNLLLRSTDPHIAELLQAAQQSSALRRLIVEGYDRPSTLFPWIQDPEATYNLIAETTRVNRHPLRPRP